MTDEQYRLEIDRLNALLDEVVRLGESSPELDAQLMAALVKKQRAEGLAPRPVHPPGSCPGSGNPGMAFVRSRGGIAQIVEVTCRLCRRRFSVDPIHGDDRDSVVPPHPQPAALYPEPR